MAAAEIEIDNCACLNFEQHYKTKGFCRAASSARFKVRAIFAAAY
jgi:hypothetical protein